MKTSDFDFELPEHLIAQTPILKRDSSRLLVLDKNTGNITHKSFTNIIDYLNKGDVLVINDTKVMPARLIGIKEETNAVMELLMLKTDVEDEWECLVKPFKRVKVGTKIKFGGNKLEAVCLDKKEEGLAIFKFNYVGILYEILDELGEMPLPPYIHEVLKDKDRYQTVYAK
ncbi:MAG: S-adenosylmethionine:tRNA ribosyltransferase-isomerase, partial [Bacilli bacterium]|nr:S-adenosylmethionine:tRNA ribosyltransferase-isomerase [Bacilli bacterium]